ncbi:phage portal protein, partial [bacterium]|nr:phage portal protein [bacterium]
TSDEGWNRATEEWLANWSLACDVRGLLDWNTIQQVATRTMLRDNELFVLLTDNGDGWPMLQLVESHRCETPAYLNGERRVIDGVRVNAQGRPLSYYINLGDTDKFSEVQSPDVIVLAERDRADELRSLSRLVTCLNLIQDREEILTNTMVSVKRSSTIGLALEGEGSAGFFGPETTTTDGITTDRILGAGAIWNVPNGRKIREIKDDRPSPNLSEFMDQFLRAVAAGLGLPYEYLWKADLSGPSQRFVLAQAQRRFDEISQAIITQLVSRVRLWALAKAIKRGDLTGRDSAADREDLKLGLTSYASIYAARGEDWQDAIDQKIAEQAYIRAKCDKAGIPVSEVQFIPNQPQPAPVTPPSAQPADEPVAVTPQPELAAGTVSVSMSAPVETSLTETFSMKDDPDLELSDKELDMVAKAVGLKNKRPAKKKRG